MLQQRFFFQPQLLQILRPVTIVPCGAVNAALVSASKL